MVRRIALGWVIWACCAWNLTRAEDQVPAEEVPRVSVTVARDRAELLHQAYITTMDVMHHKYFHDDRAVVPARAMEDVFEEMQRQTHTEARWFAVSLKAMSIDHEPATDFEKRAVREIKGGQTSVEVIEAGFYRRAFAVSLSGGCLHCHDGFGKTSSTSAKFAGLLISVPVLDSETLDSTVRP